MRYEKVTFIVPEWAMPFIHNDDRDNLTEEEESMVTNFLLSNNIAVVGVPDEGDEAYFSKSNDVGGLACNVYDIKCLIDKENDQ
jgi:hypothetical protein